MLTRIFMKLLLILLWFPLVTHTMEMLTDNTEKNVAALLLQEEETDWHKMPALPGKIIAQHLLDGHPIVPYILSHLSIPKTPLKGLTELVYTAIFNERGDLLVTHGWEENKIEDGSGYWTVRLWDIQTGRCKKTIKKFSGKVQCCDNTFLLAQESGRNGESCSLYDLESGNLLHVLEGHKKHLRDYQFNYFGTRIVATSRDAVKLWDCLTGKCVLTFIVPKDLPRIAGYQISPTEDKILVGCAEPKPASYLWDCSTGICLQTYAGSAYFDLDWNKLVTASLTEKLTKIWDVSSGKCLHTFQKLGRIEFIARDMVALISPENNLQIWDIKKNRCLYSGKGINRIDEMIYEEDHKVIIYPKTGCAQLWDFKTNSCIYTGECPPHAQRFGKSLLTDLKMHKMVTISPDDGLKIWDLTKNACIYTIPSCIDTFLTFEGKIDKMVTAATDNSLAVWDIAALFSCQQFFKKDVSLLQALLLHTIYEILIMRTLVKKKQSAKRSTGNNHTNFSVDPDNLVLDFNKFNHLEEPYEAMPPVIKKVLDPFVKRITKDS